MQDIYDTLLLRRSERNTTSPPSTNRLLNNLCAIQGPSGTGTSLMSFALSLRPSHTNHWIGKTFLLNQILQSQHKEPPLEDIQVNLYLNMNIKLPLITSLDLFLHFIQLRTELKKGKYLAVTFGSDITSVVTSDITGRLGWR